MTDSLCIYTIPPVKTFLKTTVALSKYFEDKRQRKSFVDFLKSLSLTGSPLLTNVGQINATKKYCSRSLSHFFNKTKWSAEHFENKRQQMVLKDLLKNIRVVAIDGTCLAKSGKNFENQGLAYDSRIGKVTGGFPALISTGITEDKHYSPISFMRYSEKESKCFSENQIKMKFIRNLIKLLKSVANMTKMPIFTIDSGFCRKPFIKLFLKNNIPFVVRATKRKLILESGEAVLTTQLKPGFYSNVSFENRGWKKIEGLNIVVGKSYEEKSNKLETIVLLTNLSNDDYSKTKILKIYRERWFVEESIKELKQQFGLEKFRVRSYSGSGKMLSLTLLAVTLTHLSLKKHNKWIQNVLSAFLNLKSKTKSSIYNCRKIVAKILFCGNVSNILANCGFSLVNTHNSS